MFIVYGLFMIFIGIGILIATIRSGRLILKAINSLFTWLEEKIR